MLRQCYLCCYLYFVTFVVLYGYRLPPSSFTDPNAKPGVCPQPGVGEFGVCIRECRSDSDCVGSAKCCYNGCGRLCFIPIGKGGLAFLLLILHDDNCLSQLAFIKILQC